MISKRAMCSRNVINQHPSKMLQSQLKYSSRADDFIAFYSTDCETEEKSREGTHWPQTHHATLARPALRVLTYIRSRDHGYVNVARAG